MSPFGLAGDIFELALKTGQQERASRLAAVDELLRFAVAAIGVDAVIARIETIRRIRDDET